MSRWRVRLDAGALCAVLGEGFPRPGGWSDVIREVSPGRVRLALGFAPTMLRPGGTIAGPVWMSLADTAGYIIVMAHAGPETMALTSTLTINFLRAAQPGELHADAELLSFGRRNAVCDVRLWTETPDRPAAQATVTYVRPMAAA
ncbi:MAG: PaaI family thioesterase [Proteobacteria bacterium]|nr:PaaI family thioesterase [Pseudomonadota bacterium]